MFHSIYSYFFPITPASEINFDNVERLPFLPSEIWGEVFFRLDLSSAITTKRVCKQAYLLDEKNPLYKLKLAHHFPNLFEENQKLENYYPLLRNAFLDSYYGLSPTIKKWLWWIKEGDIEPMRRLNIEDAIMLLKENTNDIRNWMKGNQSLQNYLFEAICSNYFKKSLNYYDCAPIIGFSLLHWLAILNPSEELVNALMPDDWTASDDDFCSQGYTPLFYAASLGQNEAIALLIERGADIDLGSSGENSPPFYVAAQFGHVSTLALLLQYGSRIDEPTFRMFTPLYIAVRNGHFSAVKFLIAQGANVSAQGIDGSVPLYVACQNGYFEISEELLAAGAMADVDYYQDGYTPLYVTAQNGHNKQAKALMKYPIQINRISPNGSSALYVACQNGHKNIVEMLIAKGADVEITYKNTYTPLYIAAQKGHIDVVLVLLPHIKNINQVTSRGATAIYTACLQKHFEIASILLDHSADPFIPFENGYTALHIAVKSNALDIVQLLVEKYPRLVEIMDKQDQKPIDLARKSNFHEITQFLLKSSGLKRKIQEVGDVRHLKGKRFRANS